MFMGWDVGQKTAPSVDGYATICLLSVKRPFERQPDFTRPKTVSVEEMPTSSLSALVMVHAFLNGNVN